ncbi:MAG: hypothetical protein Q9195_006063 [Heterodermia aff. obscurata]
MTEIGLVVNDFEARDPAAFRETSAMTQAYALFAMIFAGSQFVGLVLGGFVKERIGWSGMTLVLGVLCLTNAFVLTLYTQLWFKSSIVRELRQA